MRWEVGATVDGPTLPAWFEGQVGRTADAPALWSEAVELTYAQLNARANRLARRLVATGVGPERVVALVLPRSAEYVVAVLAVLKAGGTFMPVDPDLPDGWVQLLMDLGDPVAVVTIADRARHVPSGLDAPVVVADADDLGESSQGAADLGDAERSAPLSRHTGAYLLYTSGTTGRPKGVLMGAGAVVSLLAWQLRELPAGPGRTTVQFTASSFDVSLQEILGALLSGARLAVPPDAVRRDPAELVVWMERHDVTDLFAPMVVVDAVCRAALAGGSPLPRLLHVAQAGEPLVLTDALRDFFRLVPGRRLHNHYGPTETHAATSYVLPPDTDDWAEPVPIGRAVRGARLHVLDEALEPVPGRAVGELHVAGPGLARGYHRQPGLTAERFVPDPAGPPGARRYRTGDRVRRRDDGLLDYVGRTDDQVKIRGVRVEPGEVEAAIRRVPGVAGVAVAVRAAGGDRRLAAYLVAAAGAADVVAQARRAVRDRLPPALVPSSFTLLDALPLTVSGKVDRAALPEPGQPSAPSGGEPGTAEEAALCRLVARVLSAEHVGPGDDFFDLGGHSLSAAALVGRIREELGIDAGVGDVLRHPRVADLARCLAAAPGPTPVRRRDRPDRLPASFAQQRLWVLDQLEGPTPRYNEHLALRLTGRLDVDALGRALADVAARHEPLRTVLPMVDGEPCQQLLPPGAVPLPVLDVSGPELHDSLRRLLQVPFDLTAEPPWRGRLLRLAPEVHVLLLVTHHIACDAVSMGPLARDLAAAYDARRAGNEPAWADLDLRYSDYTLWQRERLGTAEPDGAGRGLAVRLAEHWAAALAGMPEVTPLPLDRPRPAEREGRGRRVAFDVGAELHARLAAVARRQRATVFMAVHAALVAALCGRGAGDDIAVGTVVSGRGDGILDDLVGFFVNTLVLRVDASGAPSPLELLRRVREVDLEALAHQELPFERVVDVANPARSTAHHPLVQVMLAFQVDEVGRPVLAGLDVAVERFDPGVSKFDLSFVVAERFGPDRAPAGLSGHVEYATDVLDRATVVGIAGSVVSALVELAGLGEREQRMPTSESTR